MSRERRDQLLALLKQTESSVLVPGGEILWMLEMLAMDDAILECERAILTRRKDGSYTPPPKRGF